MTQRPIHILLVEDDMDDHQLTVEMLAEIEDFAHTVTWARSFDAGIDGLVGQAVDICLVDYRIGGRTGLEFVQAAKRLGETAPIVCLTGMGDRKADIAAMEAGAYDFLGKSELTPAVLDRAIRYSISQAESRRALLVRTTLLQATLDNTDAAIGAVDAAGMLVTWNDRFAQLLTQLPLSGKTGGAPIDAGGNLSDLDLDRRLPLFARSWQDFDAGDGRVLSIRRNETPDGGAVIVCHDITQHKHAEDALREAISQAEAASASKSAFLASISHELRTPLNAIIGFAELMIGQARGPLGCPEYDDYISFIKESGDTLLRIINATLDLARIEAKEYKLDPSEVAVADLVQFALGPLRPAANDKKLDFEVAFERDDMTVHADESAIVKALGQLLSNAIKFSEGGCVVSISAREVDGAVHLEVSDQGIGMDPEEIRRAMSSFSQVDQQLGRKYEGAGLGLPLARALLELHGGRLTLTSSPDNGTTVTAILPISQDILDELGSEIVSETVALSA